jgi:methylenetetrahydrofolate dehydrogenase (NADP+) / methenyltetrahydrofolate cyclohydrolase
VSSAEIAHLMDGRELSYRILRATEERAYNFGVRFGRRPCLAAVLVGGDPASMEYAKLKQASCQSAGIDWRLLYLQVQSSTEEVVTAVRTLSVEPLVDWILVQQPVPSHVNERRVFDAISPDKDIDGASTFSFAAMALELPGFVSCAPAGIVRLLDEYGVEPSGKHAVVIGRTPILGKPVGMLLLARNATVTFCHSFTYDLPQVVRAADIVISAVGKPRLVRGGWLKPGAIVIDAGYSQGPVGDLALDEALSVAALIAPVPGGVGPMTIAMLLEHTVAAAERISGSNCN